jgi:hypothetical protein
MYKCEMMSACSHRIPRGLYNGSVRIPMRWTVSRSEDSVDSAADGLTEPVVISALEIAVDVAMGSVLVYLVRP